MAKFESHYTLALIYMINLIIYDLNRITLFTVINLRMVFTVVTFVGAYVC
ncbi:hypothetical protein Hanom_Chr02g00132431 [Helianthus anomalus]